MGTLKQTPSIEELIHRMIAMSNADLSVLTAAVDTASRGGGAQMSTVIGSANDDLWRALADLGWLKEELGLPIQGLEAMKLFTVEPKRVADLKNLLSQFRVRRQHQRMAEIYETFCVPFSSELLQRVKEMGGDHADIGLLLGLTVARTLHPCVAPEGHGRAVQEVASIASRRLAQERS